MKKKENEQEKTYFSVEELAEFIHTSPLMKREPKKPMSLFTKILIFILVVAVALFVYFKFLYVPYVHTTTIAFEPREYNIEGYNFITKSNNEVIFETNYIKLDENISNIVRYIDNSDTSKNYAMFLSEHGNLYLYDIDEKNVTLYYKRR